MPYNPKIHNRRSVRLKGYDYSRAGAYFITICCNNRICRFGNIIVGDGLAPAQMMLNEYGIIAYNEWIKLSQRFANFELDVFQIMPNHMHGIIVLTNVRAGFTPAQNDNAQNDMVDDIRAGASPAPTIFDIVGAYKSLAANGCLDIWKLKWAGASPAPTMGKLWQRNYHEHIIRDEQAYQTISNYIINNPAKWNDDKFYKTY